MQGTILEVHYTIDGMGNGMCRVNGIITDPVRTFGASDVPYEQVSAYIAADVLRALEVARQCREIAG